MDQREAASDDGERQCEAAPAHLLVDEVAADGDDDRQGADDRGGHRRPGELRTEGDAGVVEQVADQGEFECLLPVFAGERGEAPAI